MIDDLLGARWLPVYESQHNNKRPVVVVGTVTNKSHEHINSETFIKDIEKAIIKNGSVRLVQAGEKRQELRTERDEQNQGYTSHRRQLQKRRGCLLSGRSGTDQPGNERSGLDGR